MSEKFGPLVSATWLAQHLDDPDLRVVDFRWSYDHETGQGYSGRPAYEAAHIPGAAFVDLEEDVTGHQSGEGRHPLPNAAVFEQAMRAAGLSGDSRVVVYDDAAGFSAARLWWLLRYFGHAAVAVLDGGLQAWSGPLRGGHEEIASGNLVVAPHPEMKLDYGQIRDLPARALLLLDARRLERYLGLSEPIEARAGHIPGARSAHWRGNLAADGRFKSAEDLRRRFGEIGVDDGQTVIAYCGSGVSACHDLLALELAGLAGGRLYPGSWSDWSVREGAPVAVGRDPAA
jgi:thiosulfate/3-mercaptopyruvate sulfurtransferase